jgi:cbb3-type cytochrome oxidase maturation protein
MGLEILYLLIPATFVLAAVALILFVWAIQTGQFDDLDTPAIRVLFDDEAPGPATPPAAPTSRKLT